MCTLALSAPSPTKTDEKIYPPNPPATHHVLMGIKYFDELAKKEQVGEVIIDLYGTIVPLTVENFATIGTGFRITLDPKGETTTGITYKNTKFTKVKKNDIIEGGEVLPGISSFSIYDITFPDENFFLTHDRPGRLSLVNDGKVDNNDSRFSISMNPEGSPELDQKNVVFGQVIFGYDNLERIQLTKVNNMYKPEHDVTVVYVVVDKLMIGDLEKAQQDYVDNLAKFEDGDLSVGVKLPPTLAELKKARNSEERERLRDLKIEQYDHPALKVGLGMVGLSVLYFILRLRKRVISRSSATSGSNGNVVSLRND